MYSKRLCIYLPCYNEEGNIAELSRLWEAEREGLQRKGFELSIFAIDDKSTDNTLKVINEMEKKYDNYYAIAHEENKGLGGALNTGVRHFIANAAEDDLCVFMDGDNTHKPQYISDMIDKVCNGTECVIASRYRKGAKTLGLSGHRVLLSGIARIYYSLIFNVPKVRDYTCGYRVYSFICLQRAAEKYGDQLITQRSFSCMMELLYKLYLTGCKFDEVPFVLHYENKKGESKMSVSRTMKDSILTAIKLRRSRKDRKVK